MIHRGVALILVLATLLAVTSAVSVSVMTTANAIRINTADAQSRCALDMLHAAEPIIEQWLRTDSASAVVNSRSSMPLVPITAFDYESGYEKYRLEITAWDLFGMIPHNLDLRHPIWEDINKSSVNPNVVSLSNIADPLMPVHPSRTRDAIGGRLAVAPTLRTRQADAPILVNVNTAPMPLLNAAARIAHISELGSIIENRNEGSVTLETSHGHSRFVQLVCRSTLWAVRVDATAGSVKRSWWTVYESNGRGWSIVDRHEIAA